MPKKRPANWVTMPPDQRGWLGRQKRRQNVKRRQDAFPAGLLAALNAWHITGDPNDWTRQIYGEKVSVPQERAVSLLSMEFKYVPWGLSPEILKADAELIAELERIAKFWPGDPTAEPLHLIPLHVAVLVLRRLADGAGPGIYNQTVKALLWQADSLHKQRMTKPTTAVERAAAILNCYSATAVLYAFTALPRDVRELVGRCQNQRCPRSQPYGIGTERRFAYCDATCRVRISEAKTTVQSG